MSARLKSTAIVKHDTVGEVVTQNASYSVTRSMCVCVCVCVCVFLIVR